MRYEPPTAIVVDDSEMTAQVLCDYLKMIGVQVLGRGRDGKEAVDLYKTHKPNMVFLDIMMPDYDGFFALENIKKMNGRAKVIVVTSDLRKETSERLDHLKPAKIIYKPFAVDEIRQVVKKVMDEKSE